MSASKYKNLPLILLILDGWGIAKPNKGNAISQANTPTIKGLMRRYPHTILHAHSRYVGLPKNQVGNSEAGHMNIGAGRLVTQDSVKISAGIIDGTFAKNSAFQGAVRHVKKMNSKMHLMGMLSNGQSPHSDPRHLMALLDLMKIEGVEKVYIHLFTDGRDSPKYASLQLVEKLERKDLNGYKIATVMGRFYAMDRKKKWTRTEKAFRALTEGRGQMADSASQAITEAYNRGESDEFIEPHIIKSEGNKYNIIEDGDSVIFFNLRSDRSRQLAKAFVQNNFNKMNPGSFRRKAKLQHLFFVAMTDFGPELDDILTAYPGIDLKQTLPMQFKDLKQLYIAETEKYAHVTYFFNGGYSGTVAGEEQLMIPSPDVRSYDETPAMSSAGLAKVAIKNVKKAKNSKKKWNYDFITMNIAAPDMVGHTGNIKAGIECCGTVDKLVSQIVKAYLAVNGTVVITADHGNIEKMINLETGEIYTEHSTNPVPFIIVNKRLQRRKLKNKGILGDIAPTILKIMGQKKPKEMKGKSLI